MFVFGLEVGMIITRTVTVDRQVGAVFDYVSDFTTTTQWDPATVRTIRVTGEGGPGTTYRNTSRFLGRTTELTYVVLERSPGHRISLRGENKTVVALDTMDLRQLEPGRTAVTYRAEFTFKGIWKPIAVLLTPVLSLAFRRLGDRAEAGLGHALNALPAA
jgi:uncharacterized protein YndB with AHSA1/START domain